jgi:type I restriction enzyme S subunit
VRRKLADCLIEVTKGVGADWHKYRVLGATRDGLALAKEPVGKSPERYKLVEPGTVFYNPMRIMIGSIAMLDDDGEPGITSPDYVVLRTRDGILHPRWFYYWLRSASGEELIKSLARGAVRERMLFSRLAVGEIDLPPWEDQLRGAGQLAEVARARAALIEKLAVLDRLPAAILSKTSRVSK